jgi:acetyltransferase
MAVAAPAGAPLHFMSTITRTTDPAHDLLRSEGNPLDAIFRPASLAVIGATDRPGSVGRTVVENIRRAGFPGTFYAINPHRNEVLGVPAYPSLVAAPRGVELAVIVTPAATVPEIIHDCVAAGVRGAIIISAGFKETGAPGVRLEQEVLAEARRGSLRVIGPNCLGVMNLSSKLNATFAQSMALDGSVAFLSQSGALCTSILDWSLQENVGFSSFVSTGSMLDVGWGDLIDYFGDDPHTRSILLYIESVGDPASFLSAAREVSRSKPIIVIKAGRSAAAAKAAASHTGALTGSDDVLDAAFRRCGVLRVESIGDLFDMAEVLGKQPRPRGRRLGIITNAGGPGVLATDALLAAGGEIATLQPATLAALDERLPKHWSHGNPVDILGDADPQRLADTIEITARDPGCDGLLVVLSPQGMTDPELSAERLAAHAQGHGIPILASWMGGATVARGAALLNRAGIPTFHYPDTAARVFVYLWQYAANLRALYETPSLPPPGQTEIDRAKAATLLKNVSAAGRTLCTEWESKQLLEAYGIPTVRTEIAINADEAAGKAEAIGYPVVVKLQSETVTHKTDVGGVRLNLGSSDAVRAAFRDISDTVTGRFGTGAFTGVTVQPMIRQRGYELILGASPDPQFGPVLLFGLGGELVEVFRDRALALPPLTTTLARRMMERTRIYRAFAGVRGRQGVDLPALELLLVRFSHLVAEQRQIKEIDINPLLVSAESCLALDARVVLYDSSLADSALPQLAIRPYPTQYDSLLALQDGFICRIRPIRPEDEPLMIRFHEKLSDQTVYMRYLEKLKLDQRIAHERLARVCFIDYNREMALVALGGRNSQEEIVAVARLTKMHGVNQAEIAILIRDDFQRRGLGRGLLERLLQVARDENLTRVVAFIRTDNIGMQKLARRAGLLLDAASDPGLVIASRNFPSS